MRADIRYSITGRTARPVLDHRIGDKRVIRLITKWLNAGVMEGTDWTDTGRGTPQGANASPVLANAYLHYVLDLWVHKSWRKRKVEGDMIIVRYADDFVTGFQHRWEAERFLDDLRARLARFGLALHPDKTRLIEFGQFASADRRIVRATETFGVSGNDALVRQDQKREIRLGRRPSGSGRRTSGGSRRTARRMHWVSTRWPDGSQGHQRWLELLWPFRELRALKRLFWRSNACSCAPCAGARRKIAPIGQP